MRALQLWTPSGPPLDTLWTPSTECNMRALQLWTPSGPPLRNATCERSNCGGLHSRARHSSLPSPLHFTSSHTLHGQRCFRLVSCHIELSLIHISEPTRPEPI
eukprot:8995796-Pyramimonas_sp.AAC.1